MRKTEIIALGIVIASILINCYFYNLLPSTIASHWGANGEVNGYMSKFWSLSIMPIISLILLAMFVIMPTIDPLKKNILKFRKHFDLFVIGILLFMLYINTITILWNFYQFNMNFMILPAISLLLYMVGSLLDHAKRNWFIGIRTPWTLSSDKVWSKTNKLGAKFFKIAALIFLLSLFLGAYAFIVSILFLIIGAFYLMLYSYLEFKKL